MLIEANFDALVGPTHHFGGLGVGNVASHEHANQTSHPRQAALEGLSKAAYVASLGVPQFLLLPPVRPRWDFIERLGFRGRSRDQLEQMADVAPHAFSAAFSSAFMWAANSATTTPACDAADGKLHLTPANLLSSWHRSSEAHERTDFFKRMFGALPEFELHEPLPAILPLRDEGAANHMRLCDGSGTQGFNLFVDGAGESREATRFLPRHTRSASEAIARMHQLDTETTFFLRQHPDAVDAGAFHNDVIATSNQGLLLHHERAFLDADAELRQLDSVYKARTGMYLKRIEIEESKLPLEDAIRSYFFNSQVLSPTTHPQASAVSTTQQEGDLPRMVLVCPKQCGEIASAKRLIDALVRDSECPIEDVEFFDLGQSMANGGGPACLRLRVWMTEDELGRLPASLRLNESLSERLHEFISSRYPEQLTPADLLDPAFAEEAALISMDFNKRFLM